eukprot:CAMPEP_0202103218 /NCGR_PEP_ID=MMETSP0965-20130614/4764_1 /ASSEMBLY_ACC=CAM_ASM_000507 /TAXON_ID=4773 /ORGANISM="Schizochytrium aggregatum, Strain ATCC28209" /LENGTH=150 /DNA_ID=CAMNT_0048672009 /DNA_START=644 /DNA_END=1093 /DNA_ORIENTATION=+
MRGGGDRLVKQQRDVVDQGDGVIKVAFTAAAPSDLAVRVDEERVADKGVGNLERVFPLLERRVDGGDRRVASGVNRALEGHEQHVGEEAVEAVLVDDDLDGLQAVLAAPADSRARERLEAVALDGLAPGVEHVEAHLVEGEEEERGVVLA